MWIAPFINHFMSLLVANHSDQYCKFILLPQKLRYDIISMQNTMKALNPLNSYFPISYYTSSIIHF